MKCFNYLDLFFEFLSLFGTVLYLQQGLLNTNVQLSPDAEKVKRVIEKCFSLIFDEFYHENRERQRFNSSELRSIVKHVTTFSLTLEEANFDGNWDCTEGFEKSIMFKAIKGGARAILKHSAEKLVKSFDEIKPQFVSAGTREMASLVETTANMLTTIFSHSEFCFLHRELNYEVTVEKLLKSTQNLLFAMIEFAQNVRKEAMSELLGEPTSNTIDETADFLRNFDNMAMEFTIIFEQTIQTMPTIAQITNLVTELFDILDVMDNKENTVRFEQLDKKLETGFF